MTIETASYISQLSPTYPAAGDAKSEGDDHLRLVKTVLQTQFPNLGAAAVTPTAAQLNDVVNKAPIASPTFTGTPAAPTASTTDSSTQIATTALVSAKITAAALSSSVPVTPADARKVLTNDGTVSFWGDSVGIGGTTLTGNVTLTADSPAAMSVTPATPGLYVTLPDATTVSRSTAPFSVYNAGDFDYGVKDSAGTQLGWIRVRTGAVIGLADNTTAAGVWAYYGLEKTGITAQYVNTTLTNMGSTIRRVALDAGRTCFLFGGTDCYAIVYDASTQTWGSATIVRNVGGGGGSWQGILSAANQVLVVSFDNGTAMNATTLTIAGTGVTVNTPVAATLAGNYSSIGQLIAVGSSFVVSYGRATTTSAIRAITVSGTVPTIGAESIHGNSTGTAPMLFVSGAIVRAIVNSSSTIHSAPYTVSGSTLTLGTGASATTASAIFRAFLNGNGNIVCHYLNVNHSATIFKLTGTVEAASTVVLDTTNFALSSSDYVQVTASKTCFINYNASYLYFQILIDTDGTASVGTVYQTLTGVTVSRCQGLGANGNFARFAATANSSPYQQWTLDCSGTSPTLSTMTQHLWTGTGNPATIAASTLYGERSVGTLQNGQTMRRLAGDGMFDITFMSSGVTRNTTTPVLISPSGGVIGAAQNESISIGSPVMGGIAIQRIEAAA